MTEIVKVLDVSKHYGKKNLKIKAVDSVSFNISQGEFTAIVGPSGSGKSTLLNLIGGLDSPDHGKILLEDKAISSMSDKNLSDFRRDHIGFVFQAFNLLPVLSVAENVEYILVLQGVKPQERLERVKKILSLVGLSDYLSRRPNELSGGQQQRVAVARALVAKPKIILADEPTANLDSKSGLNLIEIMKELNQKEKATFIFSTHDPLIMEHASRVIHLKDGKLFDEEQKN